MNTLLLDSAMRKFAETFAEKVRIFMEVVRMFIASGLTEFIRAI